MKISSTVIWPCKTKTKVDKRECACEFHEVPWYDLIAAALLPLSDVNFCFDLLHVKMVLSIRWLHPFSKFDHEGLAFVDSKKSQLAFLTDVTGYSIRID